MEQPPEQTQAPPSLASARRPQPKRSILGFLCIVWLQNARWEDWSLEVCWFPRGETKACIGENCQCLKIEKERGLLTKIANGCNIWNCADPEEVETARLYVLSTYWIQCATPHNYEYNVKIGSLMGKTGKGEIIQSVYTLAPNGFISNKWEWVWHYRWQLRWCLQVCNWWQCQQQHRKTPGPKKANEPAWTIKDVSISKANRAHPQQSFCSCPGNGPHSDIYI